VPVAAQVLAILPVLGGISGFTKTILMLIISPILIIFSNKIITNFAKK
jgi:hypothetical protein